MELPLAPHPDWTPHNRWKKACGGFWNSSSLETTRQMEHSDIQVFSSALKLHPFLTRESQLASMAVVGWGQKPTADRTRHYAAHIIALEDGFPRSPDLGCKGAWPLSLVVDHTGIYYDAGRPSDLRAYSIFSAGKRRR